MKKLFFIFIIFLSFGVITASAQEAETTDTVQTAEIIPEKLEFLKAEIMSVTFKENRVMFGSSTRDIYDVVAKLEDGTLKTFENDHYLLKPGSKIFVVKRIDLNGMETFSMDEPVRTNMLFVLAGIFVILSIWIGGKQGFKGLISLAGSIILLFLFLVPSIIKGYSPVLVSLAVASVIIVLGSFITHGFNRTTGSAVLGMIATVCGVGIATIFLMKALFLTGVYSEDVVYLIFNTQGNLDVQGLLFAGIMIGLLGILYDVAIGQAIAIEELLRADPHMSFGKLIQRGIRIGREHIGALVNTLAIAYVGASLPLLLLFTTSGSGVMYILNREDVSTEIVRILIGSMSIILAVPITTYIAVYILKKYGVPGKKTEGGCVHTHAHGDVCDHVHEHDEDAKI